MFFFFFLLLSQCFSLIYWYYKIALQPVSECRPGAPKIMGGVGRRRSDVFYNARSVDGALLRNDPRCVNCAA